MRDTSTISNMRDAMVAAITDLATEHPEVVLLDADLVSCIGSGNFFKQFPDRAFNCGIAEANMVGVAAGLSSMGFVPFAHSFGVFSSRRAYDQFFLSVNYAKRRVHLIGTDPGVTAQLNGGTHMPFEDIGLMRLIPDLIILDPSDTQSCYVMSPAFILRRKLHVVIILLCARHTKAATAHTPESAEKAQRTAILLARRSSLGKASSCVKAQTLP